MFTKYEQIQARCLKESMLVYENIVFILIIFQRSLYLAYIYILGIFDGISCNYLLYNIILYNKIFKKEQVNKVKFKYKIIK